MSNLAWFCGRQDGGPAGEITASRSEVFLTDFQGRDLLTRVELALTPEAAFWDACRQCLQCRLCLRVPLAAL